jgi:glyoxylate utilization-related uncharacterized protein
MRFTSRRQRNAVMKRLRLRDTYPRLPPGSKFYIGPHAPGEVMEMGGQRYKIKEPPSGYPNQKLAVRMRDSKGWKNLPFGHYGLEPYNVVRGPEIDFRLPKTDREIPRGSYTTYTPTVSRDDIRKWALESKPKRESKLSWRGKRYQALDRMGNPLGITTANTIDDSEYSGTASLVPYRV